MSEPPLVKMKGGLSFSSKKNGNKAKKDFKLFQLFHGILFYNYKSQREGAR